MESNASRNDDLEGKIADVWREVFKLETICRDDNFFELGGNSRLGLELTEVLETRLGIQVPYVVLFQYPTVREMTEIIVAASGE